MVWEKRRGRDYYYYTKRRVGHRVVSRYVGGDPLADLITSLEEAQAGGHLQQRLKDLTHPPLLVVDEVGYLPIARTGSMLVFQLSIRGNSYRLKNQRGLWRAPEAENRSPEQDLLHKLLSLDDNITV